MAVQEMYWILQLRLLFRWDFFSFFLCQSRNRKSSKESCLLGFDLFSFCEQKSYAVVRPNLHSSNLESPPSSRLAPQELEQKGSTKLSSVHLSIQCAAMEPDQVVWHRTSQPKRATTSFPTQQFVMAYETCSIKDILKESLLRLFLRDRGQMCLGAYQYLAFGS